MKGKPNTSRWTVMKYLTDIYVPEKRESTGLAERTAMYYREAVRQLDGSQGRAVRLCEVNDAMLHRCYVWMIERGLTHKTAKSRVQDLKGIIRYWNPERFPRVLGMEKPAFIDADDSTTLDHIVVHRYFPERMAISSDATKKHYARALRLFAEFLDRPATMADLNDNSVGRYLRWLVESRKLKAVSANGYVKQLKALWVWLARKRMVAQFPTIDQLGEPDVIPVAYTREELRQLMAACHAAKGTICGIPAAPYWVAFHYVIWDTGERSGAMLSLRWEWLDMKAGCLSVPAEARKGRQKAAVYALKPETIDALKAIAKPQRDLIFVRSKFRNSFHNNYRKLILSAGLRYVKGKTGPQKMRRTFASHLEARGGNATRALKHTDRRVTDESYLDPKICETHRENEKLFSLVGEGGGE